MLDVRENGDIYDSDTGDLLVPKVRKTGFLYVRYKGEEYQIHRLVAAKFLPEFTPTCVVRHRDGDKSNNRVENLEILSRSDITNAAAGEQHGSARLTEALVRSMRHERALGASILSLSRKYNVAYATAYKVVMNETWNGV